MIDIAASANIMRYVPTIQCIVICLKNKSLQERGHVNITTRISNIIALKMETKVKKYITNIVSSIFPIIVLYLFLVYILGDWNITKYSKTGRFIIICVFIANSLLGISRPKTIHRIFNIFIALLASASILYLLTAFYAGEWSTMSLTCLERAFPVIILEIIIFFQYGSGRNITKPCKGE